MTGGDGQIRELGKCVARPGSDRREVAAGGAFDRAPGGGRLAGRGIGGRGGGAEDLDRLVADGPSGDVDDPLEADAIRVAAQDSQVGERVLDLAPTVEPRPAHELVADAVAEERFLDGARLRVHPVHHRDLARPEGRVRVVVVGAAGERGGPAADQGLDLAGDPLGFLFLVVGLEALDLHAARDLRPELLRPCAPCCATRRRGRHRGSAGSSGSCVRA